MISWPLQENRIRRGMLNHTFGMVRNGGSKGHWGWDFFAPEGTACFAIASGRVAMVYGHENDTSGFGLTLVLEFQFEGRTLYAAYCHLSGVLRREGEAIQMGQLIAFTGNSGNARCMSSEDEHLHLEIRTSPRPGPGGEPHRVSPLTVFGHCPLCETAHMCTSNV